MIVNNSGDIGIKEENNYKQNSSLTFFSEELGMPFSINITFWNGHGIQTYFLNGLVLVLSCQITLNEFPLDHEKALKSKERWHGN